MSTVKVARPVAGMMNTIARASSSYTMRVGAPVLMLARTAGVLAAGPVWAAEAPRRASEAAAKRRLRFIGSCSPLRSSGQALPVF